MSLEPTISSDLESNYSNNTHLKEKYILADRSKSMDDTRINKLIKIIYEDEIADLSKLHSLSWLGVPNELRPMTWKLLLAYVPVVKSKRSSTLERKRAEYEHLVHQYYNNRKNEDIYRQIHIDIPRMQPLMKIFQQESVQKIFERILYIWSIRHPASGYVQGMNDVVTPFFVTYLSEFIPGHSVENVEKFEISSLSDDLLRAVEADSFWSFSKLLDSIQENYTFAQPGIQRIVNLLEKIMSRVDTQLNDHLQKNNVKYLHFSFRWMNNLLIRELPLRCIIRLWDSYLSEGNWTSTSSLTTTNKANDNLNDKSNSSSTTDQNTFKKGEVGTPFGCSFHLYVCAAFLKQWSNQLLKEQDFQGLMIFLQNLPTSNWSDEHIKILVAEAFQLKCLYTPNHLNS